MTTVTKRTPSGAAGGATQRITGAITADATKRVVGTITASITVRVPEELIGLGPFLLLEGDSAGALVPEELLDHGEVDGYLKLQGSF